MYLFLECNRWRIAAVAAAAAAAAAAFEEVGIFPLCGGNGFPMHAGMLDLRFNVVRILWTLVVIFHGRLGRFEAHLIEVLFLLAQFWTVTHHPRIIKIHSEIVRSIQWWYLHWVIILNSSCNHNWSIIDVYIPFLLMFLMSSLAMKWCFCNGSMSFSITNFSSVRESIPIKSLYLCTNSSSPTLFLTRGNNIVLSNTSRECTCTFELTDVHQCNKVDFPLCCFVCLFRTFFHSFSTSAFASGINIAWGERSFIHTARFPEACVS